MNLQNLNVTRNNFPDLDLGDKKNKIAYQITSQKTSAKINETLSKITGEAESEYEIIRVFILGEKQNSYSLNNDLSSKFKFTESNIIDIDNLLKDIITLNIND